MPKTLEQKLAELRPQIEKLIRKTSENEFQDQSFITGFIFTRNGGKNGLIKFGNVENKGADLIRMHLGLSMMAAELEEHKQHNTAFIDIGEGKLESESLESLADELAVKVLTFAGEPQYASQLITLAQRYIAKKGN